VVKRLLVSVPLLLAAVVVILRLVLVFRDLTRDDVSSVLGSALGVIATGVLIWWAVRRAGRRSLAWLAEIDAKVWEQLQHGGRYATLVFVMQDSLDGLHVWQDAAGAEVANSEVRDGNTLGVWAVLITDAEGFRLEVRGSAGRSVQHWTTGLTWVDVDVIRVGPCTYGLRTLPGLIFARKHGSAIAMLVGRPTWYRFVAGDPGSAAAAIERIRHDTAAVSSVS
jgi:hypothetical protein